MGYAGDRFAPADGTGPLPWDPTQGDPTLAAAIQLAREATETAGVGIDVMEATLRNMVALHRSARELHELRETMEASARALVLLEGARATQMRAHVLAASGAILTIEELVLDAIMRGEAQSRCVADSVAGLRGSVLSLGQLCLPEGES